MENLATACVDCNASKSDRVLRGRFCEQGIRRAYTLGWVGSALMREAANLGAYELDFLASVHPADLNDAMRRTQIWLNCVRDFKNRESGKDHLLALLRLEMEVEASA